MIPPLSTSPVEDSNERKQCLFQSGSWFFSLFLPNRVSLQRKKHALCERYLWDFYEICVKFLCFPLDKQAQQQIYSL